MHESRGITKSRNDQVMHFLNNYQPPPLKLEINPHLSFLDPNGSAIDQDNNINFPRILKSRSPNEGIQPSVRSRQVYHSKSPDTILKQELSYEMPSNIKRNLRFLKDAATPSKQQQQQPHYVMEYNTSLMKISQPGMFTRTNKKTTNQQSMIKLPSILNEGQHDTWSVEQTESQYEIGAPIEQIIVQRKTVMKKLPQLDQKLKPQQGLYHGRQLIIQNPLSASNSTPELLKILSVAELKPQTKALRPPLPNLDQSLSEEDLPIINRKPRAKAKNAPQPLYNQDLNYVQPPIDHKKQSHNQQIETIQRTSTIDKYMQHPPRSKQYDTSKHNTPDQTQLISPAKFAPRYNAKPLDPGVLQNHQEFLYIKDEANNEMSVQGVRQGNNSIILTNFKKAQGKMKKKKSEQQEEVEGKEEKIKKRIEQLIDEDDVNMADGLHQPW
ncbi:hypothetical protein FGO68_gene17694 [Halteria grandinella]|uniref:Uncharacterized protein n=1 Tax=Halteria grandinella TaxID=5974 RepID=A0A8J8SVW2_HALGN|nr:hypothetical protein FGO68_gene17694 [Halteria grandinella]